MMQLLTTIVAATFTSLACGVADTKPPNIIVIYTDDHGYADLGCVGVMADVKTPNIDALAKDEGRRLCHRQGGKSHLGSNESTNFVKLGFDKEFVKHSNGPGNWSMDLTGSISCDVETEAKGRRDSGARRQPAGLRAASQGPSSCFHRPHQHSSEVRPILRSNPIARP